MDRIGEKSWRTNIMKYQLTRVKPNSYLGEVKNYDVKTSGRTGRTYINLHIDLYVEEQEVDIHTAYCLDTGRNLQIVRIMKDVGGLKKGGEADFDKLLEPYFWVNVSYNSYGELTVDSMKVAHEGELEEPEDDFEEESEEEG